LAISLIPNSRYIAKREALLHPDPVGRDVTLALRDLVGPLDRELVAKGVPFEQAVRRKRQEAGLPVPLPAKVLPLWPCADEPTGRAEQLVVAHLEQPLAEVAVDEAASAPPLREVGAARSGGHGCSEPAACEAPGQLVHWRGWAELRALSAELRMRQAYAALEAAEASVQVSPRELERLADVFAQESAACAAAEAMLVRLRDMPEVLK
jgi:hypothetical protein